MAASTLPARRRRRPRRGSLARPVNGRLYRASFLVVALPLLLLAFTVRAPDPLAKPALPGAFDTASALTLARDLANQYPDRAPGSAGAAGAAEWFAEQMRPYGLQTTATTWEDRVPGLGRVELRNLEAVVPGQSPDTIVVMAHRDDIGTGPGADDNASGTAALIELARAYAQPAGGVGVQSARRIVFLSTDGGAFGGLGAAHFVQTTHDRIVAVVNLDSIAGNGVPRLELAGNRPRSPNATLVATAVARIAEQTGKPPHHVGVLGQLIDLGFPLTLYEQGPFVGAGIPAVTVTTGGERPPSAFGDTAGRLDPATLGQLGLAAEQLLGSLDQGLALPTSAPSYVWFGGRAVQGWAIELLLISLLVPYAVAIVDLYALCRRHRVPFGPAVGALRSRLLFWLFAGAVFTCFRMLGAWPQGVDVPPNPATTIAGNWPVTALLGLAAVLLTGWAFTRPRLAPRRPIDPEEQLAGSVVALAALLVVALLVAATNPFALLFVLPALHVWLWLPQIRIARTPVRLALFALGLCGPLIVLVSLAVRFGLGFDAPWYLLELVGIGYVKTLPFLIALAGTAAAAQLAMVAGGRYAPYPRAGERGPRGPFRAFVRAVVLSFRGRRPVGPQEPADLYRAR
jgi:Peptidase family M28